MNTDKLKKYAPLFIIAGALLLLMLILLLSPSHDTLVLDRSGNYYRARSLFLFRDSMVCLKHEAVYKSRKAALQGDDDAAGISIVSLDSVALIEIFPDEEKESDDANLPIRHYGKYKINASGHHGYLYLARDGNRIYGTVRFPQWGLGSYEKLKEIRVGSDSITFTRSVTTSAEMRKTGAPVYFTQKYSGTYSHGGKFIKGQYKTSQGKFLWEAVRVK